MCDPVTAGVLLASTALGAYNTQNTLEKQDDAAAAGIREQGKLRREASQDVNQRIAELDRSNPQAIAQERLGQYMTALRRSRGDSEGSLPDVAGASSRFNTDVAAARADTRGEAATTAGRMARMDAPALQRQREGFRTADLASDIEDLGRRSDMEQYLTQLRVSGIQENPWLSAISSLGQGYATGRAGKMKAPGSGELKPFDLNTIGSRM